MAVTLVFPCIHLSGTWQVDANLVSITVFCSHNGGSIRSNGCHPPILIHSSLIVPVDTISDIKLPSHLDNTMKGGRKNALFIK